MLLPLKRVVKHPKLISLIFFKHLDYFLPVFLFVNLYWSYFLFPSFNNDFPLGYNGHEKRFGIEAYAGCWGGVWKCDHRLDVFSITTI